MSLQWTFVAGFLYTEIVLVILLMLPFIKPQMWQKIFKSRLMAIFSSYSNIYFNVFIAILLLLFFDGIREVRKYSVGSADEVDLKNNPQAEVTMHMKLFRSQRNLYIAGFAFFLWMVLKRLCTLISEQAVLMAKNEASLKQAKSASDQAQKLMKDLEDLEKEMRERGGKASRSGSMADVVVAAVADSEATKELAILKEELKDSKAALSKAESDLMALKKQAEGTNKEYDRLLNEHRDLQIKLESAEESKKDL
ncbi:B-cell receptor-associated protein 31-like [Ptychodera flava]|uniref:B-cell receptor-associated protein 31-like n=1 Tax=Ptychodera flava TaxID=63121 RepID=UPI00396A3D46